MEIFAVGVAAVAAFVGVVLSFALRFLPVLNTAWDSVEHDNKPYILLAFSLGVPAALVLLACAGGTIAVVTAYCPAPLSLQMWIDVLQVGFAVFGANQAAYQVIVKKFS